MSVTEDVPRVLIVSAYPVDPERPHGGVEAAALNLTRGLWTEFGLRAEVVSTSGVGDRDHYELPWASVSLIPAASTVARRMIAVRRAVLGAVKRVQPDVVHVQGDASLALFLQRRGLRTILTVHGIAELDARLSGRRSSRLRAHVMSLREGGARRKIKYAIAVSAYSRNFVGGSRSRIWVIPNAVDEAYYQVDREAAVAPFILYVGRIARLKNIDSLVRAFAQLANRHRDARLTLAGPGADSVYGLECRRLAGELGVGDRVTFAGPLDARSVARLMAGAAAVVLPSLQENAPMVVSEAMAVGVPVVATNVGEVGRMLEGYPLGTLVASGDVGLLRDAVGAVLEDGAPRSAKRGAELYRSSAVARATVAVYHCVLRDTA